MERKLPVGEVIGDSFRFGFDRFLLMIRLGWLPLAVLIAGGVLLSMSGVGAFGVAGIANAGLFALAIVVLIIGGLLFVPVYVILTQAAAYGRFEPPRGLFGALRFGGREGRVIGATLLLAVIFIAAVVVGSMLIAALGAVFGQGGGGGVLVLVLVGIAFVAVLLWLYTRLLLFVPLAAIENRISLSAAWAATKGNAWRLFAVVLVFAALSIAISLVFQAIQLTALTVGQVGGGAAVVTILVGLLQIPIQLWQSLVGIAYPAKSLGALRPPTEAELSDVFA